MRIGCLFVASVLGGLAGLIAAASVSVFFGRFNHDLPADLHTASSPMPHFVPKYEGGVSLRYAMVHDVIHERFPVHGPAYYRARDRQAREKLKTLPPDSPEAFDLIDDIAVGLDRLGRPGDAVPLLRDKLDRQRKQGLDGRSLYTTFANLGTMLIHANLKAAMTGDAAAKNRAEEGLDFVQQSIGVNPAAHFGREEWQHKTGSYLLDCGRHPDQLTKFDCVGNQFDTTPEPRYQRAVYDGYARFEHGEFADQFTPTGELKDAKSRDQIRELIRRVGHDEAHGYVHNRGVPFDEPTLGIIGMWRQGGGANPYFAVALGEIMLRVGQRYVAWTAYERAYQLADKYGWKPEHADFLRDHCRGRQQEIEAKLPADEVPQLRPRFEAELAYGRQFQQEYQQYEADRLAAGADLRDEHFYDAFYQGREPIATPVGPAEWYARSDPAVVDRLRTRAAWSAGLLWGGIVCFAVVLLGRVIGWLRPRANLGLREVPPGGSPVPPEAGPEPFAEGGRGGGLA